MFKKAYVGFAEVAGLFRGFRRLGVRTLMLHHFIFKEVPVRAKGLEYVPLRKIGIDGELRGK